MSRFRIDVAQGLGLREFPVASRAAMVAAVCLGFGLVSCGPSSPTAPVPRDVLLITIDTARADRFSYTGATGPGTPRVDALAREGAGFVNAVAPTPLTLPSHASLLTGRQPPSHTVRDNGSFKLPDSETTLAEVLAAEGFETAAFIGATVLDARHGLDQGFGHYDDQIGLADGSPFLSYPERSAEEVADRALEWLDARGQRPVFVWVHLYDPHTPYLPPEPERSRYASRYDGEIAYVDRIIGRVLDRWEERRGLDRSLVVVTSDHGESLGEHGEKTHGVLIYESTLRVPLVIRAPGRRVSEPIAEPVHLVDVMPTILSILDLQSPDAVQGRNLVPLLEGRPIDRTPITGYAESLYAQLHHGCAPLFALRSARYKLVRGVDNELYDLSVDPGEQDDCSARQPQIVDELLTMLEQSLLELENPAAEYVILDDDARNSLEALGYLSSRRPTTAGVCDPREALVSLGRMAEADRLVVEGNLPGAVEIYRSVIASEPASVDARIRLASLFGHEGRQDEAVALLREAVAVAPHEPVLHYKLGYALERSGHSKLALAAYDAGLMAHPGERDLRNGRWRCLNRLRRLDVMLAEAERAVAEDPSDGMARFARAVACCSHPLADYIAALERELAELPGNPHLEEALKAARAEAGR